MPLQLGPSPWRRTAAPRPARAAPAVRHWSSHHCPSRSLRPGGGRPVQRPAMAWLRVSAPARCRSRMLSQSAWGSRPGRPASTPPTARRTARRIRVQAPSARTACCGGAADWWSRRTSSWLTRRTRFRARRRPAGRSGSEYERDTAASGSGLNCVSENDESLWRRIKVSDRKNALCTALLTTC